MKYQIVAEAYRDLEQAGGRLALTDRLAALLARTPAELLPLSSRARKSHRVVG